MKRVDEPARPASRRNGRFGAFRVGPVGSLKVWLFIGPAIVMSTPIIVRLSGPIEYVRHPFEETIPYLIPATAMVWLSVLEIALRWARRTLVDLDLTPEAARGRLDELASCPPWVTRGGLAVALVWTLPFHEINTGRWTRFASGDWNLFDVWVALVVTGSMIVTVQATLAVLHTTLVLSRAGRDDLRLDLYRARQGAPLARLAVRLCMVAAVGAALTGVGPGIAGFAGPALVLPTAIVNVAFCVALVALLVGPFVRRMQVAKNDELAVIDAAAGGDPSALSQSHAGNRLGSLGFVQLLTYRREVENLRTWPLDQRLWGQLALYGALPLLSWVAAALVERAIDRILGAG